MLLAFYILLNGLEFIPLSIVIIYIGSIAILFLFVVIIINPDYRDILDESRLLIKI